MGGLLIVIAVLAIAVAYSLQKTWLAVRTLQARCATELSELHRHLASHHLIVSHLVDSLPEAFAGQLDRAKVAEVRKRAEQSMRVIDAACPRATDIRKFSRHQQAMIELIASMTDRITASASIREIESVSGCLQGLADADRTISDTTSAYNASVITYCTFLESPQSSFVARIINSPAEFCVVDMGQYSSGSSTSC